jgi:ABC-2 type transport system permease protein
MRNILALLRAEWLARSSYRLSMLLSLAGMLVSMIPIYFIAGAIQPIAAESIQTEGGVYFSFLLVGMIALWFVNVAVTALPSAISAGVGSGTLEALLGTPARLPALLGGLTLYPFVWTAIRTLVVVALGVVLHVEFVWTKMLPGVGILLLTAATYTAFGALAAAAVLAFRTPTPLPQVVPVISALLGGAYYSTTVIPSWIQYLSGFVPLTYGLRALRRLILEGAALRAVAADVAVLIGFAVVLNAIGLYVFARALRYARRAGTLSHY